MAQQRLMTTEEAAEYIRVSKLTLQGWARDGLIPAMRAGREWRFNREDLDAHMRQQGRPLAVAE